MKRFLLFPSCALLAFGVLTSCQKEDMTAQQLADELTAELQKVTDYKTAEAAAPRVEVLNKRFQNASVRVFSMGNNALVNSTASGYSDSVIALAKEVGRIRASKPVLTSDGELDDERLVRTVGAGAGASADSAAKKQKKAGEKYLQNDSDQNNNNPPVFAECYGSQNLYNALEYTANVAEFGFFRFDKDEDVPAIPAAGDNISDVDDDDDSTEDSGEEKTSSEDGDDTTTPAADDDDDTTPSVPAKDDDDDDIGGLDPDSDDDSSSASTSSSDDDDDSGSSSSSDDDDDALITIDDDL